MVDVVPWLGGGSAKAFLVTQEAGRFVIAAQLSSWAGCVLGSSILSTRASNDLLWQRYWYLHVARSLHTRKPMVPTGFIFPLSA